MIKILGLSLYGPLAASTRYRLSQYVDGLAQHGIELQVRHLLGDDYLRRRFAGSAIPGMTLARAVAARLSDLLQQSRFDAAMLYCELIPLLPGRIENLLLRLPYVYDLDDAFYLKYRMGRLRGMRSLLDGKIDQVVRRAAGVTAGSRVLAVYAGSHNPGTHYLPTVVDVRRYLPQPAQRARDAFTVGWIGSPSTAEYLQQLVEPLSVIGREGPVRFVVVGGKAPAVPNVEVVEIPWSERDEIRDINGFNVGVMPLPDTEWSRGKCAFKLVQYMACGVPVIASPVGANVDVVSPDTGELADSADDWVEALRTLRDDPHRRSMLGEAARTRIEQHYSLQRNLPLLANILRQTAGKEHYVRNSGIPDA